MNSIDPNHDGKISFEEFVRLLSSVESQLLGNEADPGDIEGEIDIEGANPDSKVLDFLRFELV